jgi:hypothetical protein
MSPVEYFMFYKHYKGVAVDRLEKHAWFNIGVIAVTCLVFSLAYSYIGIQAASSCFALLALLAAPPSLFYPKGKMSEILDERERGIARRAKATAFGVFWVIFISSFMLVWSLNFGSNITLPADFLPLVVLFAGILFILTYSITMLVLSRTGIKHAE